MRLDFASSWTSAGALFSASAGAAAPVSLAESSFDSSPTLRMIVPASSDSGLASSSTTLPSRLLLNVSWNLPRRMRSLSLRGASTIGTPLTWVPFFDLRSTMRAPSSSTTILACWREIPKSFRTTLHSGDRPITTSPVAKVKLWEVSPSWYMRRYTAP